MHTGIRDGDGRHMCMHMPIHKGFKRIMQQEVWVARQDGVCTHVYSRGMSPMHMSIHTPIRMPILRSIHMLVYRSILRSIHISIHIYIHTSILRSTHMSIHGSIFRTKHSSIHMSIYMSMHMSIHTSILGFIRVHTRHTELVQL